MSKSIVYEIAHYDISAARLLRGGKDGTPGKPKKDTIISTKTQKIYKDAAIKFGRWCRATYGCREMKDCRPYIQEYIDALLKQGKSPSTIHTHAAAIGRYWGMSIYAIKKPSRTVSKNTRSRGIKPSDDRPNAKRECSPRLYDFAEAVGIRRAEYGRLCGDDLVVDESGYLCVRVKRGKGGKYQEQRILPGNTELIKTYFDGSTEKLFTEAEMKNHIDLHHLRALVAQRAYQYYVDRLAAEPGYRQQLKDEVKVRWALRNHTAKGTPREQKKGIDEGWYKLRGDNRRFAEAHGLPTRYDKLAVLATSIFHLSHWRNDVTVTNYLLAI